MMDIPQKITKLRNTMESAGFHAFIITGGDPHGNEIPPEHWQSRKWISGFTGSAGTIVITRDNAGLWTDGRYWIQAAKQLAGTPITLFKTGESDIPAPEEWLARTLPANSTVSVDGQTVSTEVAENWMQVLSGAGIKLDTSQDILKHIWTDRPATPNSPVTELTMTETGESRTEKLNRLRIEMQEHKATEWVATALDTTAWLLNIRGNDIPNTPVALGNMIVGHDKAIWYTNTSRLAPELIDSLAQDGVKVLSTERFLQDLAALPVSSRILIDKSRLNYATYASLPNGVTGVETADPVYAMKARKNPIELDHLRRAMAKDGVAVVRFFMEVETRLTNGEPMDELTAVEILYKHRAAMPGFLGNSFSTIAAAGENSTKCHYLPDTASNARLDEIPPENAVFLLDSGAQWVDGTTDLTRMIALAPPSESIQRQMRRDYTLVLKAHIAVSRMIFPILTRGYQIDAIARSGLWNEGIDFGHGTGHGVGYRLGVHEGPQVLSPKPIDVCLEPGMVVSNEPGLYREGQYGIRIENLLVCQPGETTEFGEFYRFETLTLAPYCKALMDTALLNTDETAWINAYHAMVREKLTPLLSEDESRWLNQSTSAI